MQNILVPLDGSSMAEAVLPFASALAARAGASLTLVHAARYHTLFRDIDVQQVRAIDRGEEYLARIATRLRSNGIPVDTRVPLGGSPVDWILEESDFCHADLIAMATHDRDGPDRWVHGSVTETVVRRSRVPVMLVKSTTSALLAQGFEVHEPILLVPVDGSELADAALPVAGELARASGARVVLLAVAPKPVQARGEADAWACVNSRIGYLGEVAGVESAVWYGDVATEISAAAVQYAAAAVVMATHGRTGPVRSLLGSVAGAVVHGASVPVVLIHPTGSEPAETPVAREPAAGPAR